MSAPSIDSLSGYRRRFVVTPGPGQVCSELEDDYHCMGVTVRHTDGVAVAIEPMMERAPWTTCPGAVAQLKDTFTGVALDAFAMRGDKQANCTHLHDLAVLAAAHADDERPLVYDILVSDPIDGLRRAELRRNGAMVLSWTVANETIVEPVELAGVKLFAMQPWIKTLDTDGQEAAKLLRWGNLVANGRMIPLEQQSDARAMPQGACYTFQPQRAAVAKRVGQIRDFSRGTAHPLDRRPGAATQPETAGVPPSIDAVLRQDGGTPHEDE